MAMYYQKFCCFPVHTRLFFQVLISPEQSVPDGFKLIAPGAEIAVKATWLHSALASIRQPKRRRDSQRKQSKMETLIIKRLIDGFYDIYDLAVSGGTTSFQNTPVYKGLKCKY